VKETCSLSRQKLKRHSASLAQGLQQAGFSACRHQQQVKPLLCQQWYFIGKKCWYKKGRGVEAALVQTSGSCQEVVCSLMVESHLQYGTFYRGI